LTAEAVNTYDVPTGLLFSYDKVSWHSSYRLACCDVSLNLISTVACGLGKDRTNYAEAMFTPSRKDTL